MAKNYEFTVDVNIDYTRAKSETAAFIANQRAALESLSRVSGQPLGRSKVDEEGNVPTQFANVAPETASNASSAARNKILAADQLYIDSTTLVALTRRETAAKEQANLNDVLLHGSLTKPDPNAPRGRDPATGRFLPKPTIDSDLGALLKKEALNEIEAERITAQALLRRAAAINSLPDENGVSGRQNLINEQAAAAVVQAEETAAIGAEIAQRRSVNDKLIGAIAETAVAQRIEASKINLQKAQGAAGDLGLIQREAETAVLQRSVTERERAEVARIILANEGRELDEIVERTANETLLNNAVKRRTAISVQAQTSQADINEAGQAAAANRELAQATKIVSQRLLAANSVYVDSLAESTLIQRNISARQNAAANATLLGVKAPSLTDPTGPAATQQYEAFSTVSGSLLANQRKVEQLNQLKNLPGGREGYIAAEADATAGQKLLNAEIRAESRQRLAASQAYTDALGAGVVAQREIDSKRAAFVASAGRGTSNDPVANEQAQSTALRDAETKVAEAYNSAAAKIAEQAAIGAEDSASRAAYIAAQAEATAGERALAKITEAEVAERLAADPAYIASQARVTVANKDLARRIESEVATQTNASQPGSAGTFQRLQAYIKNLNKAPIDRVDAEAQTKLSQFVGQKALTTGGFAVSGVALYGTFNAIKTAVEEANKFQVNMVAIQQLLRSTDEAGQFPKIRGALLDLSNQTGIAGSEVSQLFLLMKGAFGDTAAAIKQTGEALKVSVVAGLNDGEITNLLLGIAKAYNTSIGSIGDAALGIQQRTGVAAKEVITGLGQIAPVASEVGLSISHIGNILAIAEQQSGRSAASIAENFNRILPAIQKNGTAILDLIASVPGLDGEFQKLGSALNQGQTGVFFEDLIQVFDKLNPAAQNTIIELIGGRREAGALIPVLRNVGQLNELNAKSATDAGLTNEYFAKTMATLHRQLTVLSNEFRNFIGLLFRAGIADAFVLALSVVSELFGGLQLVAGALKDINDFSQGLLGKFAGLAALVVVFNKLRGGGGLSIGTGIVGKVTGASEVNASITAAAGELKGAAASSAATQRAGATEAAESFTTGISGAASEFVAAVSGELESAVAGAAVELQAGAARAAEELTAGATRAAEILATVNAPTEVSAGAANSELVAGAEAAATTLSEGATAASERLLAGAESVSGEFVAGGIQAGEEVLAGAIRASLELRASAGAFAATIADAAATFTATISGADIVAIPETSGLIAAAEELAAAGVQVAANIVDSGSVLVASVTDAAAGFAEAQALGIDTSRPVQQVSTVEIDAALASVTEAADELALAGTQTAEFIVDAAGTFVVEIADAAVAFATSIGEASIIGIDTSALTAGLQAELETTALEFGNIVRDSAELLNEGAIAAAENLDLGSQAAIGGFIEGLQLEGQSFFDLIQVAAIEAAETLTASADAFSIAVSEGGGGVGAALTTSAETFSTSVLEAGQGFRAAVAEAIGSVVVPETVAPVSTEAISAAATQLAEAGETVATQLVAASEEFAATVAEGATFIIDAGTAFLESVNAASTAINLASGADIIGPLATELEAAGVRFGVTLEEAGVGFTSSIFRGVEAFREAAGEFGNTLARATEITRDAIVEAGQDFRLEIQAAVTDLLESTSTVLEASEATATSLRAAGIAVSNELESAGQVFLNTVAASAEGFSTAVAEAVGSIVVPEAVAAAPVEISTEAITVAADALAQAGLSVAAELNTAGTDVAALFRSAAETFVTAIGEATSALVTASENVVVTSVPETSAAGAATELQVGADAAALRLIEGATLAGDQFVASARIAGEILVAASRAAAGTTIAETAAPVAPVVAPVTGLAQSGAAVTAAVGEVEVATVALGDAAATLAAAEAERVTAEQALTEARLTASEAEFEVATSIFDESVAASSDAAASFTAALAEARAAFASISGELASISPELAGAAAELHAAIVGSATEFAQIVVASGGETAAELVNGGAVTAAELVNGGAAGAAGAAAGNLGRTAGALGANSGILTEGIEGGGFLAAASKIPVLPVAIGAFVGITLVKKAIDDAKKDDKRAAEFGKKVSEEYLKQHKDILTRYNTLLAGDRITLPKIEPLSLNDVKSLRSSGYSASDITKITGETERNDAQFITDFSKSVNDQRDEAIKSAGEAFDKAHQSLADKLSKIPVIGALTTAGRQGKRRKEKAKAQSEAGKTFDQSEFDTILKPQIEELQKQITDGGTVLALDPGKVVDERQKALDKADEALRKGIKDGLSTDALRGLEKKRSTAVKHLDLAKETDKLGELGAVSGEAASQQLGQVLSDLGDGTDRAKNKIVEKYLEKLLTSKNPKVRQTGKSAADIVANYKNQLAAVSNSSETSAQLDELKALYDAGADTGQYQSALRKHIEDLQALKAAPGGLAIPELRLELANAIKAENEFVNAKAQQAEDNANFVDALYRGSGDPLGSAQDKLANAKTKFDALKDLPVGSPERKAAAQEVLTALHDEWVEAVKRKKVSVEEQIRILEHGQPLDISLLTELGQKFRRNTGARDDPRTANATLDVEQLAKDQAAVAERQKLLDANNSAKATLAAHGDPVKLARVKVDDAAAQVRAARKAGDDATQAAVTFFQALLDLQIAQIEAGYKLSKQAIELDIQRHQGNPGALAADAARLAALDTQHGKDLAAIGAPGAVDVVNQAAKDTIAAGEQRAAYQDSINAAQLNLAAAQTEDPVKQAQIAIQQADQQAAVAARLGDIPGQLNAAAQRLQAQRSLNDALSQIASAHNAYLIAVANFYGDSVKAAQLNLQETRRVLQEAISQGKGQAAIEQAGAAAINAMAAARDAAFADQASIIDFNLHLKKISTSTAVAELNALLAAEKAAGVGGQALRDLEAKIYDLKQSLNQDLQYNLPSDLKLPTLYEARRLNQSGATDSSSHYQDNRQIVINVNGAQDPKQVTQQVVNALNAPNRYGVRPRTY